MCKRCENYVGITWKVRWINYYFPHVINIVCFIYYLFHIILNMNYTHFTQQKNRVFNLFLLVFYTHFTPPTITTNLNKEYI